MRIIPLSEGTFSIGKDKVFHPFDGQKDELQHRPVGSLLVEVQPFCVVTATDVLLLDAGLGFTLNKELQLHHNLRANGIQPEEVTKVLMTHLHKDHAGGVSIKDRLGNAHRAFPNAVYYVQRREFDAAMEAGYPSYFSEELQCLDDNNHVIWLHDDTGNIDPHIRFQVTGGHSKYHQVFWIETAEGTIFFGGDDAPQQKQMINRFVAKYDYDGKKCMELRQQWWEEGKREGWTFLFYHDTRHAVAKAV
jgi:glyoxylase-like metal-dependent hydrolase (beta-lactamase superfamily II)